MDGVLLAPRAGVYTVFLMHVSHLPCVLSLLDDIEVEFVPERWAANLGPGNLAIGER